MKYVYTVHIKYTHSVYPYFNPLRTKRVCVIQGLGAYRPVNTVCLTSAASLLTLCKVKVHTEHCFLSVRSGGTWNGCWTL